MLLTFDFPAHEFKVGEDDTDVICEQYEYETTLKDNEKIIKLLAFNFAGDYRIKEDRAIEIMKDYERIVEIYALEYIDDVKHLLYNKAYKQWKEEQ